VRFRSRAVMQGNPTFRVRTKSGPIAVEVSGEGALRVAAGPVTARIDEIPITLTIPFLRRNGGVQTVASVGGFCVQLERFDVDVPAFGVRVHGVVGKDGMQCTIGGKIGCKTELDLSGTIPGKVARVAIQIADEEDVDGLKE
jgi:hypothetical protein